MTTLLSLLVLSQNPSLHFAPLFTDGCVLQRDTPVRIWGRGEPNQPVEVGLDEEKRVKGVANAQGVWEVMLPPHRTGAVHTLSANTVKIGNVVFGEVWVCSGQSNMEFTMGGVEDAKTDIPASGNPMVRMFTVTKATSESPVDDVAASNWMEANPENTPSFSAVGYYFAKRLQQELNVPVGVIHTSWGGTRIEAWTSQDANRKQGMNDSDFHAASNPAMQKRIERWKAAGSPTGPYVDSGRAASTQGWEADSADTGWKKAHVPGEWSSLGVDELFAIDGGVWFRKKIEVPASWTGKTAVLHLGPIDDVDISFVNGTKVGAIGTDTPNWWSVPRIYNLAADVLKSGTNLITVRVWDHTSGGGINGRDEDMYLQNADGEKLPIAGEWDYRIEAVRPEPANVDPNTASVLYNAMLAPVSKYTAKGALWYQGESNSDNPPAYRTKLPAMVEDWRVAFHNPDLYFYAVQLAPFTNEGSQKTSYAFLREAIAQVRTRTRHADSVVITDVGNETDIHPRQKGPVGTRLALLAAESVYRRRITGHSPTYKGSMVDGGKIVVSFDHVGQGLTVKGGLNSYVDLPGDRLLGFQIAGDDKNFVDADAKIVGKDRVEVSAASVASPKYVRFGFINFPKVNFWSLDGFPVEPFRTDPD